MARYSDLQTLTPESRSEVNERNSERQSEFAGFKDVKYAEAYLRKLENITSVDIATRAFQKVTEENPGADIETIKMLAKERAATGVAERDRKRAALRQSLEAARGMGAGERVRNNYDQEMTGQDDTLSPITEDQSFPLKALSVLGAPARAIDGFWTGAMRPLREATKNEPREVPAPGSVHVSNVPVQEMVNVQNEKVDALQQNLIATQPNNGTSVTTPGAMPPSAAAGIAKLLGGLVATFAPEDLPTVTSSTQGLPQQGTYYHDVPLKSVPGVVAKDPSILKDMLMTGLSVAEANAKDLTPSAQHGSSTFIREGKRQRIERALEIAKKENPQATPDQLKTRVREIYAWWSEQDVGMTNSPDLSQLTTEVALDPLNVVPVGKGVQLAANAARATRLGKAVEKGARYVTGPLRWASETTDALEMAKMGDAASVVRMARQGADAPRAVFDKMRGGSLEVLRKLSPDDRELVTRAIEEGAEYPAKLQPAVDAARNLADTKQALIRSAKGDGLGLGQTFDDNGKLLSAEEHSVENYVPRRVRLDDTPSTGDVSVARGSVIPGSEERRMLESREGTFSYDAYENWRKELEDLETKSVAGLEIRNLARMGEEGGYLHTLNAANVKGAEDTIQATSALRAEANAAFAEGKISQEKLDEVLDLHERAFKNVEDTTARAQAIDAKIKDLTEKTGVEWVPLQDKIKETWQRLGGNPGELKGAKEYIVPKVVEDRVRSLMPLFLRLPAEKSARPVERFAEGYAKVMDYVIRPINQTWRVSKTIINPAFTPANMASGVGMVAFAHGMRAADPRLQMAAAKSALVAAGFGSKEALAAKFTLRSGETRTLEELLNISKRYGIVDTLDSLMGHVSSGTNKNLVSKALRALGEKEGAQSLVKAAELADRYAPTEMLNRAVAFDLPGIRKVGALSPANMARMGDNYQHLAVFLGALEDTSAKGIAKALDFTAKFAGNYRRLGWAEKAFLKETMGFYSWMRFVTPMLFKQVYENPQRIVKILSARNAAERSLGANTPYTQYGVAPHLKAAGLPAPTYMQPPFIKEMRETGKVPDSMDHESAMMLVDDPVSLGLGILPVLQSIGSRWAGAFPQDAKEGDPRAMLSPLLTLALDTFAPATEGVSATKNFVSGFYDRPVGSWKNLIDLYSGQVEGDRLRAMYKAGRDFYGLDRLVASVLGYEGKSLGSGIPGVRAYVNDPVRNISNNSARAAKQIVPFARQQAKE
jgi:hypothetical protein